MRVEKVFVACGASTDTDSSAKAVASRQSSFILIQPQAAPHVTQQSHQHFGHLREPLPGDHQVQGVLWELKPWLWFCSHGLLGVGRSHPVVRVNPVQPGERSWYQPSV